MKSIAFPPRAKQHFTGLAVVTGIPWERVWAVKNGGNIPGNLSNDADLAASDLSQIPSKKLDHASPDLPQMVLLVTGAQQQAERTLSFSSCTTIGMRNASRHSSGFENAMGEQKAVLHTHPAEWKKNFQAKASYD